MAIHSDLPIHRQGVQLLALAVAAQPHMRREIKRVLGDRITQYCVDLLELMALANATQRDVRAAHLRELLVRHRALTVLLRVAHDSGNLSPRLWARSIELLGNIGRQAGGWLKSANKAPAACRSRLSCPRARWIWSRRTTRPRTLRTALQRLLAMPAADVHAAGNSYLGMVRQATHSHAERAATRWRGCTCPRLSGGVPHDPTPEWHAFCAPLRACALCVHGQGRGAERVCASPAVTRGGAFVPRPVALARRAGQACGPEAAHLHIAAWGPLP